MPACRDRPARRNPASPRPSRPSAGGCDAVGFLTLFGLFTAHLSGNTARLGVELGQGEVSLALTYLVPIVVFIGGVMAGSWFMAAHRDRNTLPPLLAVEALLVTTFMVVGTALHDAGDVTPRSAAYYGLAVLATVAMGLQTSSLRHVCDVAVHTTFVTGMITLVRRGARRVGAPRAGRAAAGAHPRQPRRVLPRRRGVRLGARHVVAAVVARDPGCGAGRAERRDAPAGTGRARRREAALSEDPTALALGAPAPYAVIDAELEGVLETLGLHRALGAHRRARSTPTPSEGKNAPGAASRQRARSIHAGV